MVLWKIHESTTYGYERGSRTILQQLAYRRGSGSRDLTNPDTVRSFEGR